ncbi:MAG TPA: hypothetical protein DCS30_00075 [Rhizobiales bacterium]|nr:hypothetical protein [Hyphomicrobiales bacterium]
MIPVCLPLPLRSELAWEDMLHVCFEPILPFSILPILEYFETAVFGKNGPKRALALLGKDRQSG